MQRDLPDFRDGPSDVRDVPSGRRATGEIRAPASKSHAIRLLVAAALAKGTSTVRGVPEAADVRAATDALRALGVDVRVEGGVCHVSGCDGLLPDRDGAETRLDVGGSGTSLRLLAAVCCLGSGPYVLDGDASLRARPVGSAVEVVSALGCRAQTSAGSPPLRVSGGPVFRVPEGIPCPDTSRSSQPLSALLLVAGALPGRLALTVPGGAVSLGYVRLTLQVLADFGVPVSWTSAAPAGPDAPLRRLAVGDATLQARDATVAGDWSSASYLLAAAAVSEGEVVVRGLDARSPQPDAAIVEILRRMGADVTPGENSVTCRGVGRLRGVRVSLAGAPDLAPLLGALGCVADGVTEVVDAPHLRIKESDRIASVVRAARALGCEAEERPDGFLVHGGGRGGVVDPVGDHRLAMAFAVAGLRISGVRVRDPDCVGKSYPAFWSDLARLLAGA